MKAATIILSLLFLLFIASSSSYSTPPFPSERQGIGNARPGAVRGLDSEGISSSTGAAGVERERRPSRLTPPPHQVKKKAVILKIAGPEILKKKSRFKVHGRFLQTGRVKCATTPKLLLKEVVRNEKLIQYQIETNVDATQYMVKCSGIGASKKIVALGDKKTISSQKTGNIIAGSGQIDLKGTITLRGKIKTRAGDSQSLKLVVYNNAKPGKTGNTYKQQPYKAKIFLSATNLCRETLTVQHPLSKPLAQRKLSFMTIPSAGKSQTLNSLFPCPIHWQRATITGT